ncbi:hypothetical protein HanPSC8_Chr13g0566761 [Helianthus annuus]|nr:hypothetical protein HanPSC8_Chr13g0566761 [Helianthus annuus]
MSFGSWELYYINLGRLDNSDVKRWVTDTVSKWIVTCAEDKSLKSEAWTCGVDL